MTTATISEQARRYLNEVRNGLADVLSPDDVDEVIQDLEAHLAELNPDAIEDELGSPAEFIGEFRDSAGLTDEKRSTGRIAGLRRTTSTAASRAKRWTRRVVAPVLDPLMARRDEISTAWIWSRGVLALIALSFLAEYDTYGHQGWLLPKNGHLLVQLGLLGLATFVSVQLGQAKGKWWQRLSFLASVGVGFVLLTAAFTTHYTPYPQETAVVFYGDDANADIGYGPDQLVGPNGLVENIHAYDLGGNPVQVLLYDQDGNPLLTVPEHVFEVYEWDEFMWGPYEIRFVEDTAGEPVVNLYPLARYEWTENGARSAPQPPPIVGIPEISAVNDD